MKERALKNVGSASTTPTTAATSTPFSGLQEPVPYGLRAVIVHLGAVNSGHYVTYRRGPPPPGPEGDALYGKKWYLTSDDQVEQTSWPVVRSSHAYMLFYERL